MDVINRRSSSTLNPNAPLFVPWAYRMVEDFSDEWWELVHTSPWFRDYWLQECYQEPQNELDFSSNDDLFLPDIDAVFDGYRQHEEDEKGSGELVSLGSLKWRKPRILDASPRYYQKAPKIVNVKVSPRTIQQPR